MIKYQTIYFGYGTINIRSQWYTISFIPIKPPQEVGSSLVTQWLNGEIQATGPAVEFTLEYKDCKILKTLLNSINEKYNAFTFKGYTFDFSNYNPKSVQAFQKSVDHILNNYMPLLAC